MCVFIRAPPRRSGAPRAAGPRLTRRPKDSGRAPADSFLSRGGSCLGVSPFTEPQGSSPLQKRRLAGEFGCRHLAASGTTSSAAGLTDARKERQLSEESPASSGRHYTPMSWIREQILLIRVFFFSSSSFS